MRVLSLFCALSMMLLSIAGVGAAVLEEACTPAQAVQQAEDLSLVVLRGLLNHETLAQIEADVQQALMALDAGAAAIDIAAVVEDALTLLLDSGLIPTNLIPTALSMRTDAHATRRTSPAAVHPQ